MLGGCALTVVLVTAVITAGSAQALANDDNPNNLTAGSWGEVETSVQKLVHVSASPNGTPTNAVMVTELSAVGNGQSEITVPVGTSDVRNLDGVFSPTTQGDQAKYQLRVNGATAQRTMSPADPGPVTVSAFATINRKPLAPEDVVNKTGILEVTYMVKNTTAKTQPLSFTDTRGQVQTSDQEIADPIVGTLNLDLPPGFTDVTAAGATTSGDGSGGTRLSYSMMLFPPLGATEQKFSYTARIIGGNLPGATFTFVPIVPTENDLAEAQKTQLQTQSTSGSELVANSMKLDASLTTVQASASKLVSGLIKTAAGAAILARKSGRSAPVAKVISLGSDALATDLGTVQLPRSEQITGLTATSVPTAQHLADELKPEGTIGKGLREIRDGLTSLRSTALEIPDRLDALDLEVALLAEHMKTVADQQAVLNLIASQTNGNGTLKDVRNQYCPSSSDPIACNAAHDVIIEQIKDVSQKLSDVLNGASGNRGTTRLLQDMGTGLAATRTSVKELTNGLRDLLLRTDILILSVSGKQADSSASQAQQLADSIDAAALGANQLTGSLNIASDSAEAIAFGNTRLARSTAITAELAAIIAKSAATKPRHAKRIDNRTGKIKKREVTDLSNAGESLDNAANLKLAQLEHAQLAAVAGAGIPYGPATGPGVRTTGAYQLVLAPSDVKGPVTMIVLLVVSLAIMFGAALLGTRRRKRA